MTRIQRFYNLVNVAVHEIRSNHPFVANYLVSNSTATGLTLYTLQKNRIDHHEAEQRGIGVEEEMRRIKFLLDENNHDHDVEYEFGAGR